MRTTERQILLYAATVFDPSDVVEVRRLRRAAPGRPPGARSTWHPAAALAELARPLQADNAAGWDVYCGANPRPAAGVRGDAAIAVARTLFADFDHAAPADALARVAAAGLPDPTLVVASGHGAHCYWRLARPLEDLAAWSAAQRRLIAALGSDPAIHNPERIMRLPGFLNRKREPLVACEVVACDPAAHHELAAITAALDAAAAAAGGQTGGMTTAPTGTPPVRGPARRGGAAGRATGGGGVIGRFNAANDVAAVLRAHGYTDAGGRGRMNRPGGTTAGVHLLGGRSFHFSTNDPLNDRRFGHFACHDAFSAYRLLAHGGDTRRAVRAAAAALGVKREHTERWHVRRRAIRALARQVASTTLTPDPTEAP